MEEEEEAVEEVVEVVEGKEGEEEEEEVRRKKQRIRQTGLLREVFDIRKEINSARISFEKRELTRIMHPH